MGTELLALIPNASDPSSLSPPIVAEESSVIAFSRSTDDATESNIWIINEDGTDLQLLMDRSCFSFVIGAFEEA